MIYVHHIRLFSFSNQTIEICTVEIKLNASIFILIGIYRPHSDTVQNFTSCLNDFLNTPEFSNRTIIIFGDINICLLRGDPSNIEFSNMLYSNHFMPLITQPTRFSPISTEIPSLLDHIWINNFVSHECGIVDLDLTDHLPTFVNFFSNINISKPK